MKRSGAILLLVFGLLPLLTLHAQGRGEILRAEYGSGYRWVDITQRVRMLFRGNNLSFRADNQTLGGDPAPGVPKTLRLVIREDNGRIRQVEFAENQSVILRGFNYGSNSSGLRILGAQYGVENRMMDVTDRLISQIRGSQLNLRVINQTMGGDPAKGLSKSLWVWYTFNGQPGQAVVNENGVLNLPGQGGYNRRELLITQAQYGINNRFVDVTARLNALVRDGKLNLQVVNQTMGGDPAKGQAKALQVWYTFNGRPGQAIAYENEVLNLPGEIAYNNDPRRNFPDNGNYPDNRDGRYNGDNRDNGGYRGNNNNAPPDIQTVRCESINNQRKYCSVDTRGGVLLLRALSNAPCNQGSTWGFDQDAVWVDYGCRADFQVRASDSRRF